MITRYRLLPLYTLIAALPTILTVFLLVGVVGVRLADYQPIWNDEFIYWHEIDLFHDVGFNGGYTTFGENAAPAAFSHFGAHGFGFAVLVGLPARIFGLSPLTVPIFNIICLSAALLVYLWWVKPRPIQLALIAFLLLTWYPLILYLFTSMQEAFHHAIAAVLAGCFALAFQRPNRRLIAAIFALIALVSILRMPWAFLFAPLFLAFIPAEQAHLNPLSRRIVVAGLAAGICITAAIALYWFIVAPDPGVYTATLGEQFGTSFFNGIVSLLRYLLNNLRRIPVGNPLELLLRAHLLILLALSVINIFIPRLLKCREAVFVALTLGIVFFMQALLRDIYDWRDYRMFAPYVFLCLLVLIIRGYHRLVAVLLIFNLIGIGAFFTTLPTFYTHKFTFPAEKIAAFRAVLDAESMYNPDAPSAWCNTMLVSDYTPELMGVPDGIGFGLMYGVRDANQPLRSRYLMLNDADLEWANGLMRIAPLIETQVGTIYLNEDADC